MVKRQEPGASVVASWRVAVMKEETETRIDQERVSLAEGAASLRPLSLAEHTFTWC